MVDQSINNILSVARCFVICGKLCLWLSHGVTSLLRSQFVYNLCLWQVCGLFFMLRKARAIKNRSVIKSTIFNILIHGYCKMVICLYSLDNHNFLFVFFLKKKPSATFPFKTILARCSHTRTKIHCKQLDPLLNYVKIPRKLQKEFTNK